jgi:plasmid stability protein
MANVLIRGLDEGVVGALKARAAENGRSLQRELHAILGEAAATVQERRKRLAYYERAKALGDRLAASGRTFGDSTADIRADRDSGYGHDW